MAHVHEPVKSRCLNICNTVELLSHFCSEEHLEGVPSLTGSDLLKVQMANSLYKAAVVILEVCRRIGCCITIENPLRSWLWMLLAHYVRLTGNQALIEWYSGFGVWLCLMHAPMGVTETKERSSWLHPLSFQISNNIAHKITNIDKMLPMP